MNFPLQPTYWTRLARVPFFGRFQNGMRIQVPSLVLFFGSLLLVLAALPQSVSAQATGQIRGFVEQKGNREPLIYTNVYVEELERGTATDENGFFSIDGVPPGSYTLRSTSIGYDTARAQVRVRANQIAEVTLLAEEAQVALEEVEVSDKRTIKQNQVRTSVTKATIRDIERIPTIGGEPDFAQYLQVLPGVVNTGDQGGQLYIRGGSPIQNKVLLDGMTIYNPFHSIGFFSVFDADIMRTADIYTGGFGAEYGGRVSAVMDVRTRNGSNENFGGKVGISPFTSKLILEGPVSRATGDRKAFSSFLFSARTSYLDQTDEWFYAYADSNGLPFSFRDFYGKYSISTNKGSRIDFFGMNFQDRAQFRDVSTFEWNSTGFGTRFLFLPPASSTTLEGSFAYSDYRIDQEQTVLGGNADGDGSSNRFSEIGGFELNLDFNYYPGGDQIQYGIDINGFNTNYTYQNFFNREIEQKQFTTELAGYVTYRFVSDRWVLEPSMRAHYYASLQELSPEPRLGVKYKYTDYIRLKAAGGFYSQNFVSGRSDRDVVNLFYGFLTGSEEFPNEFDGEDLGTRLQKARHAILGAEVDFNEYFTFETEAYVKDFTNLTDINRNKLFEDDVDDVPAYLREDYIPETGLARGFELKGTLTYEDLFFYAAYSYSIVERDDGRRVYNPHWDRRHNVNLVGSYRFGKENRWKAGARWNLGSGFPFTQTQGLYEFLSVGTISQDILNTNGRVGVDYGPLNDGRLPYYHRLDLTIERRQKFESGNELTARLSVTNAYDRNNIFYYDRLLARRVNQLPILPSLGLSYSF